MKFYNLTSIIPFGKYNQMTVENVLAFDKSYIDWCLINLDHFVIDDDFINELVSRDRSFQFSIEAEQARVTKLENYHQERASLDGDDFEYSEDNYGSSGEKYGWYNGFSDDAIDDAFEGDPMNTWNVD